MFPTPPTPLGEALAAAERLVDLALPAVAVAALFALLFLLAVTARGAR